MQEKKYPTSKLIAVVVWIFPAILIGLEIWAVIKEKSATVVGSIATMFVAAIAISGYVVKCYMKKSSLENILLAFVRFIKSMIGIQKEYPNYEIYPASQIKRDVQYVSDVYKQEIQNSIKTTVTEDVTTKIS